MTASTDPEEILCYFLRHEITEPTRPGTVLPTLRTASTTYSPTGDGVTTTFTITPPSGTLCTVSSVTVASVAKKEYVDYTVDIIAKQVIFVTAPANLAAIVITYIYGTNWIHPGDVRDTLAESSYPRVGTLSLDENEQQKQGMGETDTYDAAIFQIDVLAYKDMVCTLSGASMEGSKLAKAIARDIMNKIRRNLDLKIGAKLFKPKILSNRRVPFEEDQNVFRHIVEVRLEAFNIGE